MSMTACFAAAAVLTGATGLAEVDTDFSFVGLFLAAAPVVKVVMGILLAASVWSWAIIVEKLLSLGGQKRRANDVRGYLLSADWSMNGLRERLRQFPRRDPHIEIHDAVVDEFQRLTEGGRAPRSAELLAERIERKASNALVVALARTENGLGVLASVASAAPFIGLLGTVWGIMNSFRAIAGSGEANLAVVAPGIAEALFATALGLLAAIPAVIFFNKFSTDVGRYQGLLEGYADELSADLSRRAQERAH